MKSFFPIYRRVLQMTILELILYHRYLRFLLHIFFLFIFIHFSSYIVIKHYHSLLTVSYFFSYFSYYSCFSYFSYFSFFVLLISDRLFFFIFTVRREICSVHHLVRTYSSAYVRTSWGQSETLCRSDFDATHR